MSALSDFLLASNANVVQLDTFELSHSLFSQTYRFVRNAVDGITATLEDASVVVFDYYPVKVERTSARTDLEQLLTVTFGDLGELLPSELDRVRAGDGFEEFPLVKYRTFRSDDLAAPLYGPIEMQVQKLLHNWEGAILTCSPALSNANKTGERQTIPRFPMLRGLL